MWIQIWEIPKHWYIFHILWSYHLERPSWTAERLKTRTCTNVSEDFSEILRTDGASMLTSTGEELVLCSYLLKSLSLSLPLSPVSVSFVLFLRHHSHLILSHSLYFPPRSLGVYLSPSHALFFLIKSALYRESLLWRWFKRKAWHKLHIAVRPKQIPSAMVKFAALAIVQKAFYSRANICTAPPHFSCHWTNMFMLPVSKTIVSFLTTFSHILKASHHVFVQ